MALPCAGAGIKLGIKWIKLGHTGNRTGDPAMKEADVMPERQIARTLTNPQRDEALRILQYVFAEIDRYANGNEDLAFRMRRFVHARVQLKNRGTVPEREKLRTTIFEKQKGLCAFCSQRVELSGSHIHRTDSNRYTDANTVLMHVKCHEEHHRTLGEPAESEEWTGTEIAGVPGQRSTTHPSMNQRRILEIAADHVEKDGYVAYADFIELKPVDQIGSTYLFPVKACLKKHGHICHEAQHRAQWIGCGYPGRKTHFHRS